MAEIVDVIDIDLSKLQEEAEDTGQTLKELKDEVKDLKKQLDNTTVGSDDFAKSLDLLNKKQAELKNATRTVGKDVTGSYNALSKQMSELKKVWKATGDEAERAQLGEQINDINDQLKALDSTIGNSQRNVGNYQSALEGLDDITLNDKIESSEKLAENMGHVARLGAGLSGVFEIVQGGMNLMGVESEKMEEAMLKIQSLMAITQGLSAVGDSVESFTKLSKAVKESSVISKLFNKAKKEESVTIVANTAVQKANTVATKAGTVATKGLRTALISTGIGAIIVGIGAAIAAVIDNWDKLTAAFSGAKDQSDEFKASIDALESSLESLGRERNLDIELMKVEGATDLEVINKQRENARNDLSRIQAEYDRLRNKTKLNKKEKEELARLAELEQEAYDKVQELNDKATVASAKVRKEKADAEKKDAEDRKKRREEDAKARKAQAEEDAKAEAEKRKTILENLAELRKSIKSEQEQELIDNQEHLDEELAQIQEAIDNELISTEEASQLKNDITDKYEAKKLDIIKKYNDKQVEEAKKAQEQLIATETSRYRTEDSNLYGKYVGGITDAEDKGYTFEAGASRLEYLKEQNKLLEEHRNKLIELQATEEQLAEVDAMIAENKANQVAAEKEMWQGRLEGMNLLLEATNTAAQSIIGIGDGLSSAWSNVFTALQTGINRTGESLKKGEKGWQTYANIVGDSLGAVSSVMLALADEQDENSKEGFEKEKKFQIAAVLMNTLSGIINATTSAMSPMNAWMTLPGQIALAASTSAMVGALGAVQVSKIKQTQFDGSGNLGGASEPLSSPSISAIDKISKPIAYTSDVQGASTEGQVPDTKVYVTETDITNTQDRVRVAETEATY